MRSLSASQIYCWFSGLLCLIYHIALQYLVYGFPLEFASVLGTYVLLLRFSLVHAQRLKSMLLIQSYAAFCYVLLFFDIQIILTLIYM